MAGKWITRSELIRKIDELRGRKEPTRYGIEYGWSSQGTHAETGVGYGVSLDRAIRAKQDAATQWRRQLLRLMDDLGVDRLGQDPVWVRHQQVRTLNPLSGMMYLHGRSRVALRVGQNLETDKSMWTGPHFYKVKLKRGSPKKRSNSFHHEEMWREAQRACGHCGTIDCVGECVLGELHGELQSHIEGTHEPPAWAATERDRLDAIRYLKKAIAEIEGSVRQGNPKLRRFGGLRRAMGRHHVGTSDEEIEKIVRRDLKRAARELKKAGEPPLTKREETQAVKDALKAHHQNQKEYREVMRGYNPTQFGEPIYQERGGGYSERNPFRSRLSGGKVPVGSWTFDYYPHPPSAAKLGFLVRSAQERQAMDAERKKDHVVITGSAAQHSGLVRSLQGLGWPGEVVEHKLKQRNPRRRRGYNPTQFGENYVRIRRDPDTDEWVVQWILPSGRISEAKTYYTSDKDDALETVAYIVGRGEAQRAPKGFRVTGNPRRRRNPYLAIVG